MKLDITKILGIFIALFTIFGAIGSMYNYKYVKPVCADVEVLKETQTKQGTIMYDFLKKQESMSNDISEQKVHIQYIKENGKHMMSILERIENKI